MQAIAALLIWFSVLAFFSWLIGSIAGVSTSNSSDLKKSDETEGEFIQVKQSSGHQQKQAINDLEIDDIAATQARKDEEDRNRLHRLHDIDMEQRENEHDDSVQTANAAQSNPWDS
jgi:hypothetical protein